MNKLFGKKADPKEELRQQDRQMKKSERELVREDAKLERQEKQIELEIKKAARQGQNEACKMYAKQLIQVRKQREKTKTVKSQLTGIRYQAQAMGANAALANTVGSAAKAMQGVNGAIKPAELAKTMNDFKMVSERMGMTDEMMNDALDDILDEEGDEEESQNVLDKVLDEIGIEIKGKLSEAPNAQGDIPQASKSTAADDIEQQLARLKAM